MDAQRRTVSFPLTSGWAGYALTAAIVAIRAFQPGAEPMSSWSWWSWLLMTIPALFPAYVWIFVGALWLLSRWSVSVLGRILQ